jgi:thiol-disulfide isomerase/thioredoxin
MSFSALKKSFKRVLLASVLPTVVFASPAFAAELFPAFSSRTLGGETVSNAIFADAKLTVINIWATWCPPCLAEIPDLGRLGHSMPEGSRLVGILFDAGESGAMDDAKKILADADADFVQIFPVEEMTSFLEGIDAIPTTIFVNARGEIVGEPLVGSRSEKDYRAAIEKILESMPQNP